MFPAIVNNTLKNFLNLIKIISECRSSLKDENRIPVTTIISLIENPNEIKQINERIFCACLGKIIHSYCIWLHLHASPLQKIAGIYNIPCCVNSFLDANKKYMQLQVRCQPARGGKLSESRKILQKRFSFKSLKFFKKSEQKI